MNQEVQTGSNWYRWYGLGLMLVVYVFNFIDRSILGILAPSIKEELDISDSLIGMLAGISFAIFYTFVGIPIARLADTRVRKNILAVCLVLWSGATALSGMANNFVQLLGTRVLVAVGESGGSPPSHSMISDMFPPHMRATALGIYALGIPIGTLIGNTVGGWADDTHGWRTAFFIVGLPGLLLALLVKFTLREPVRGAMEPEKVNAPTPPPILEVFQTLWKRRSFRYLSIGSGLHSFVGYGVGFWLPSMFNRSHELTSTEMGFALGYLGISSAAGTFLGGYFTDKLGVRDKRWYVWLPGIATLVTVPFLAFAYLWHDPWTALWVLAIPWFLGAFYLAPTFSLTQGLVGLRMRAVAASVLLFILNLIGLGLGIQAAGWLSDYLNYTTELGPDSLRWALVACLVFNVVSTLLYFLAGKTLRGDLAANDETPPVTQPELSTSEASP